MFVAVGAGYLAGATLSLLAVCLGGYLVYRTKRESHEPLFTSIARKIDAKPVNIDDINYNEPAQDDTDAGAELINTQTSKFIDQLRSKKSA